MTSDRPDERRPAGTRRLLWFAALWAASLISFSAGVYILRWLLAP
jgi:hypothetical protein